MSSRDVVGARNARGLGSASLTSRARDVVVEGYVREQRDRVRWYVFDTATLELPGVAGRDVVGRAGAMIAALSADDECAHGWLPSDGEQRRPKGCTCGLEPSRVVA